MSHFSTRASFRWTTIKCEVLVECSYVSQIALSRGFRFGLDNRQKFAGIFELSLQYELELHLGSTNNCRLDSWSSAMEKLYTSEHYNKLQCLLFHQAWKNEEVFFPSNTTIPKTMNWARCLVLKMHFTSERDLELYLLLRPVNIFHQKIF